MAESLDRLVRDGLIGLLEGRELRPGERVQALATAEAWLGRHTTPRRVEGYAPGRRTPGWKQSDFPDEGQEEVPDDSPEGRALRQMISTPATAKGQANPGRCRG